MWCGSRSYILVILLAAVPSAHSVPTSSGSHLPIANLTNTTTTCPAWTIPDQTHPNWTTLAKNRCKCVGSIYYYHAITCTDFESPPEVLVLDGFCVTQNQKKSYLVYGSCPYFRLNATLFRAVPLYRILPANVDDVCNVLKRRGQFCGQCMQNYSPPVYSYDLNCVHCPTGTNNWGKYLAISLLPTTVLFFLALMFRFRATSPQLNVYIMACQLVSSPIVVRYAVKYSYLHHVHLSAKYLSGFAFTLMSMWNLDFFKLIYSPFCLHPHASMLQVLSLDYITAVYPLALIILTYTLVTLHYRGCPLVLWLWRPFLMCFARLRRRWDIRNSLLDVFATFLLLSYMKFLSVSSDILFLTISWDINQSRQQTVLYYNGTLEYFGTEHLPYASLAITVLLVFTLFPILLLCCYPCRCFRKFLNKVNMNGRTLQVFMDIFQGSFKDGTEGTKDYRYFASFYLLIRVGSYFAFSIFGYSRLVAIPLIILLLTILFISYSHPYKTYFYNILDSIFIALVIAGIIIEFTIKPYEHGAGFIFHPSSIVVAILAGIILMYLPCLILYTVYIRLLSQRAITQKIKALFLKYMYLARRQCTEERSPTVTECSPLLTVSYEHGTIQP